MGPSFGVLKSLGGGNPNPRGESGLADGCLQTGEKGDVLKKNKKSLAGLA